MPSLESNSRTRRLAVAITAVVLVTSVLLATGGPHAQLLDNLSVFKDKKSIAGVTQFLTDIRGYLLSIVLAGFTVAGVAVAAAKFAGHTRANDMIFNIGVGIAILAAIPTLAA